MVSWVEHEKKFYNLGVSFESNSEIFFLFVWKRMLWLLRVASNESQFMF